MTTNVSVLPKQLRELYDKASDSTDPVILVRAFNVLVTAYERLIILGWDDSGALTAERKTEMMDTTLKLAHQLIDNINPNAAPKLPDNVIQFPKGGDNNDTVH